jgi:hypothetical protein
MDVVSTANGDELAIAEHGDNLLSTKSSGCFQQLFGKHDDSSDVRVRDMTCVMHDDMMMHK